MQGLTGMSKKDAQASYKDFKKEAGGEKIKLDKFTKLVNSMNTNKGLVIYIYNFYTTTKYCGEIREKEMTSLSLDSNPSQ